jgi:hypothetical protein
MRLSIKSKASSMPLSSKINKEENKIKSPMRFISQWFKKFKLWNNKRNSNKFKTLEDN